MYNIAVEAHYYKEKLSCDVQNVEVIIPGPPNAPEIWLRNVGEEEFTIEWGEPRLHVVKIRGYQV